MNFAPQASIFGLPFLIQKLIDTLFLSLQIFVNVVVGFTNMKPLKI